MTPENKVKARLRVLLKELGAYSLSVTTNGMGESGHPDRVACLRGQFLGIECKATAKQQPTALQLKRLTDCDAAGGMAFIVDADNFDKFSQLLIALAATGEDHFAIKPIWR